MNVEVISNEIIKPSSPTPDNLRHYKLSFIDQITPKAYNPVIYYYPLTDHSEDHESNIANLSLKIKKSLSDALTLYYPLAGRYADEKSVNCNDAGVPFITARVTETKFLDFLENPAENELNKLLPFDLHEIGEAFLGVQLNVFACGSIAIGVCVSHGVADGLSSLVFIKSWMGITRGENNAVQPPEFISADIFPPKDLHGLDRSFMIAKKGTVQTKLFVFKDSKIATLREKYSLDGKRPSRVEALSTFLWSRFRAATKAALKPNARKGKFTVISHAVNIRPKFDPPLPEHSFGNLFDSSATIPSLATSESELARKIGEDIRKVDKDAVEKLRNAGDEIVDHLKGSSEMFLKEDIDMMVFTSLCRFPLYEADFGFGKPVWVSSAARCFKNVVGYMDNKAGDGIETYVCLSPEDMAKFEADEEFLAFVSW